MSKAIVLVLVLACLVAVGCAAQSPEVAVQPTSAAEATAPAQPTPAKSGTIRFFDISNLDVRDVPLLMALDALRAQGYVVEVTYLTTSSLIADALARGDAEIGLLNNQTMWTAIDKGANVRTIAEPVGPTTVLAAQQSVTSCMELDGRPVGLASTSGISPARLDQYLRENCPGVAPQYLVIRESSGRAAALLSGELDAALVPAEELLKIQQQEPGKLHVLVDMARVFSQVRQDGLHVRTEWARENPQVVEDFLREFLTANRKVLDDRQLLRDESVARLSLDQATAAAVGDSHLAQGVWDPNGGLTPENVQTTLDFLVEIGSLPAGLKVEDVSDLSYLDAVLDEMGRR